MFPRFAATVLLACLISLVPVLTARATLLIGDTEGTPDSALSPDKKFEVSLTTIPVSNLTGPTDAEQRLLTRNGYKNWNFRYGGPPGTGTFNVLQYGAFALNTLGGANFTVLYDDEVAAPRTNYNWVQFAYPTRWGRFDSRPNVDSSPPNNKNSPFYDSLTTQNLPTATTGRISFYVNSGAIWRDTSNYPTQNIQNPAGGGKVPAGDLLLVDQPVCSYTCLMGGMPSMITFDTYLVTFARGTVTFLDGFSWGVQIACAPPQPGLAPCDHCQCGARIPEPPSILLFLSCLGLIALRWSTVRDGR